MAIINAQNRLQALGQQEETLQNRLNRLDEFQGQVNPWVRQGVADISKNTVGGQMPSEFWNRDIQQVDRQRMSRENARADLSEISKLLQSAYESQQDRELEMFKAGAKQNPQTGELMGAEGTSIEELLKLKKLYQDTGVPTTTIDEQLLNMGIDVKEMSKDDKEVLEAVDRLLATDTDSITGFLKLRGKIAGTGSKNNKLLYEKIRSKATLAQRKMLQGQGTISDFESKLLAAGATELSDDMTNDEFRATLERIKYSTVNKGEVMPSQGDVVNAKSIADEIWSQ